MARSCDNCGASTDGSFCPACGQPVAGIDMPARDFLRELIHEVFALDSRASLTLGLLFRRPGAVALAYVGGHRARFVPPIRLYLFASFLMFLIMSFGTGLQVNEVVVNGEVIQRPAVVDSGSTAGSPPGSGVDAESVTGDSVTDDSATDEPSDLRFRLAERLETGMLRGTDDIAAFSETFLSRLAQSMFLLLPAFAGILKMAYRSRLYVHHVVFSLYFHSFVFLLSAVVALPDALGLTAVSAWTDAILLVVPAHLLIAMKRFYDQSWVVTSLKWGLASLLYGLLGALTLTGILMLGILTA